VTDAVFAPLDDLARFDLWSEAHRVIDLACRLLSSASDGMRTFSRS